jgi:hypothetical protein
LEKVWRQNLCNLCLQIGYMEFDASAWIACLDAMGQRAVETEDKMRTVRRSQMSLAL